jgi:hypothetical protein
VFRDFLGQMNRKVAEIADSVVLMVAGLPMMVKSPTIREVPVGTSVAYETATRVLESAGEVRKGY